MIIFHCSAAAAVHLDGNRRGKDSLFPTLADEGKPFSTSPADNIFRWVVHAVKIGHATCLIAMEVKTRWVHVIHQVRKGDLQGFLARLSTRFINGIEWSEADLSVLTPTEMGAAIDTYLAQHHELRFSRQTDRSVMSHIAQVSSEYRDVWQNVGAFPENEETALSFDLRLNATLRSTRGSEYWLPVEAMLTQWLNAYATPGQDGISEAISRRRSAIMQRRVQDAIENEHHADNSVNKVIDFESFKKKMLH
ncbi:hypothetical protein OLZ31_14620 [Enterobacter asburiae]|nr:hypothetical protein [Enterobacter asburiae]